MVSYEASELTFNVSLRHPSLLLLLALHACWLPSFLPPFLPSFLHPFLPSVACSPSSPGFLFIHPFLPARCFRDPSPPGVARCRDHVRLALLSVLLAILRRLRLFSVPSRRPDSCSHSLHSPALLPLQGCLGVGASGGRIRAGLERSRGIAEEARRGDAGRGEAKHPAVVGGSWLGAGIAARPLQIALRCSEVKGTAGPGGARRGTASGFGGRRFRQRDFSLHAVLIS